MCKNPVVSQRHNNPERKEIDMYRHLYCNLIKTVCFFALLCIFLPFAVYFGCVFFIYGEIHTASMVALLSCAALYCLAVLTVSLLNKVSKKRILFADGKMQYGGKTFRKEDVSMRYFKFEMSIINETLVFPKLYINGNGWSVICYLSRKDIEKLKKMNYEITEM